MVYTVSTLTSSMRMSTYLTEQRATLDKALIENATGKHADMGLTLGAQTGTTTSFRSEYSMLDSQLDSNKQLIMRLDVMGTSLNNVEQSTTQFRSDLIALRDNNGTLDTAATLARTEMDKLTSAMNTNVGGVYVFGGTNTGETPMTDFEAVPDGPEAKIKEAFQNKFGFPVDDPAAANISPADFQSFLDNEYAALFDDPNWGNTWSSATDDTMTSTINQGVTIQGSGSANDQAFRDQAEGLAMVAVFGNANLSKETGKVLIDTSADKLNTGIGGTVTTAAQYGAIKTNVERTNTSIEAQKTVLNSRINDLENVDPNRAAVELSQAQTQLEATYSITAKIQNLNILKYL